MTEQLYRALEVVALEMPIRAYDALNVYRDQDYTVLLESRGEVSALGRYSFLCVDPFLVFRSKGDECSAGPPGDLRSLPGKPFDELKAILARFKAGTTTWAPGLPPFVGGAAGYLGYEMLYQLERVPNLGRDDLALPDACLVFCGTVIASDAKDRRSWVLSTGMGATLAEAEAQAAHRSLDAMTRIDSGNLPSMIDRPTVQMREKGREMRQGRPRLRDEDVAASGFRSVVDHAGYVKMVQAAKDHIFAGDIFEVCITNRFDAEFGAPGLALYKLLSGVSESPFAVYMRTPEFELASSSPERFLRLDRTGWADTRPIKGTRPRGKTPAEDQRQRDDLATCVKDQAENIMIVDLARNDLGRVCEFGTVTVPELRIIETYPFVHQLVSTIRGRLNPGVDAVDLIKATFPGGSMTGAPKVEAMKIIDRLEPVKRGIYSGSIGYFDFDGSFDLNIVIRTLIKIGDHLTFHVGGAVVADSDPEEEYQETLDKAYGMIATLEIARAAGLR